MTSAIHSRGHRFVWLPIAAAALLAVSMSAAEAASVTLCAERYAQVLPGPNAPAGGVPMWGYRQVATAAACASGVGIGTASPGPLLTVPPGDTTLAITLVNSLTVPTSIVLMGQDLPTDGGAPVSAVDLVGPSCDPTAGSVADRLACRVRSFTGETAPGATRTYTFANLKPGTYLYQSGTHPQVQVQMGLFGMVEQDAQASGSATRLLSSDAASAFDLDLPVVLSEIDPAQHALIDSTLGSADPSSWKAGNNSTLKYEPKFFLINGKVFAGVASDGSAATDLPIAAASGSRVILRMANAGLQSRNLMLTSGMWKLLGEDGSPYVAAREQSTALLPAGKTTDALIVSVAPTDGSTNRALAIFDRRGGTDNADGSALGGQVARIAQSAPVGSFISPIGPQVANEGSAFSLQVQGSNISGYSLSGAPAGMTISATGLITWAVPLGTSVPTSADVTVNGTGVTAVVPVTFSARVNHTPTMAQTGPIAVAHGTVTVPVAGVLAGATDPDGDAPLTAVQTVAASSGTLTLNTNGSYTWTGPQPATGTSPVTFSVAARDPFGLQSAPRTVTLNVAANVPPVAVNDAYTLTLARVPLINTLRSVNDALQITAMTRPVSTLTANDTDDGAIAATTIARVVPVPPLSGTISARRINPASPAGCTTNCATIAPPALGGSQASVTMNANGTFILRPHATVLTIPVPGTYEFRYTVRDDQNALSNQAVVRVTVQ
jgi:Bacterial Ig domain